MRLLPKTLALPMDEEKTTVRALFSAPERGRPEYAALAVGLVMIDDLVMEELRNGSATSSAYSAYTRLSQAAAPSASLSIRGATSAAKAKSAFTRAAALVAEGECLGVSGIAPIEAVIEGYKGRALGRIYANGAKAIDIAERVARDLAAGGDGSWYFRMAARVAAAKPEDISRIVRERIVEGASSWLASGAAGGLAGFASP